MLTVIAEIFHLVSVYIECVSQLEGTQHQTVLYFCSKFVINIYKLDYLVETSEA